MSGIEPHLPALQVVVPLLTAPLLLLLGVRGLPWVAATAASLLSFAISLSLAMDVWAGAVITYDVGSWAAPHGIELRVDSLSALLLLITTGSSSLMLVAGKRSVDVEVETHRQPLFYATWLLALAGLVGMLVAGDAFNIFVFMEIGSLATYTLVAAGRDRRGLTAAFKYLVMGTIGATFYLIGVGLIYMMTGTLNLADMEARLSGSADLMPIILAAGAITVGLALKSAILPMHAWLPNAYTFAPHIVTAFIAACSTKVMIYVLLRVDFLVLQQNLAAHAERFSSFLMPLALLGILAASVIALLQGNLKRMLAYSSIAQIGYIVLGASLLSVPGLTGSILHIFNHALAKGALFLAAACLAMRFARLDLDALAGAGQRMPWTMMAFVISGLSLIGIPGTAGFISKWYLVLAALEADLAGWMLIAAIGIGSLLAVAYIWRVVEIAYFTAPAGHALARQEAPWTLLVPTWLAVAANVYFGLNPEFPRELAARAAALLLSHVQ